MIDETPDVAEVVGPEIAEPVVEHQLAGRERAPLRLSVSFRGLLFGGLIEGLVVAAGALAWLYFIADGKRDAQARHSANTAHAEEVALDYANNAAATNSQDLSGWKTKLVAGTSPELKDRLSKAADQIEQILVPAQWNSTSGPLPAKVRSSTGSVYTVDSFVSVLTKTAGAPAGGSPRRPTASPSMPAKAGKLPMPAGSA